MLKLLKGYENKSIENWRGYAVAMLLYDISQNKIKDSKITKPDIHYYSKDQL